MKRGLGKLCVCMLTVLLSGVLYMGSGAHSAFADEGAPADREFVIGDRVFGPEDGLAVEEHVIPAGSSPRAARPMGVTKYSKGSSWVSTNHYLQFWYTGRAQAMGNRYSSKGRVIAAGFKYSRGGKDLISWKYSRAKQVGCQWRKGPVVQATVNDSLGWNDPKTKFHYNFITIHPNIC